MSRGCRPSCADRPHRPARPRRWRRPCRARRSTSMSRPQILLVEDEGLVAMTMEDMLVDLGCDIAGSFGGVAAALAWLAGEPALDGALLDVNLGGEMVFPVADVLIARGVPIIFA